MSHDKSGICVRKKNGIQIIYGSRHLDSPIITAIDGLNDRTAETDSINNIGVNSKTDISLTVTPVEITVQSIPPLVVLTRVPPNVHAYPTEEFTNFTEPRVLPCGKGFCHFHPCAPAFEIEMTAIIRIQKVFMFLFISGLYYDQG